MPTVIISSGITSSGLVVSSGNGLEVYGSADDTSVLSGGSASVLSGGKMVVTQVAESAFLDVCGGVANSTTVLGGGRVLVSSGGSANVNSIKSGGSMTVGASGRASLVANSGGILTVSSATLNNVTVSGNTNKWYGETAMARMNVSGKGNIIGGSAVNACRIMVYSGGVVSNFVAHTSTHLYAYANALISGGEVHCANLEVRGGTVRHTLVNSGGLLNFTRVMSGQAVSVTIGSKGSAYIGSGGTMTDTLVSGHDGGSAVVIASSGAALRTTVMSLGTLSLRTVNTYVPSVTSTTLSKGGNLILSNGGLALSTTISSGGLAIVSGGVLSDTVQFDTGRTSVYKGGVASGATLNSGAKLILYSAGSADAVTVNANGYLYLYSGKSGDSMARVMTEQQPQQP